MSLFFIFSGKGQFAVEYLLVTGFLFMLLTPTLYILYNYSQQSQEQLSLARANEVGNAIIANAEKVYYYGKGSKLTIQATMPPLVDEFYYRCITNACEVVFRIRESELSFTTIAPLASESDSPACSKCPFGKNQQDQERFRAAGQKTFTLTHTPDDKVDIKIE